MAFPRASVFIRQYTAMRPLFARQFVAPSSDRIFFQACPNIQFRTLTTQLEAAAATRSIPRKGGLPFVFTTVGVASVGLGLSALSRPHIHCDRT